MAVDVSRITIYVSHWSSFGARSVTVELPPHISAHPLLAVGHTEINCSSTELVTVDPPSGSSCGTFLQEYISHVGGYVTNPGATGGCQFCSARTTDQWMGPNFNIYYEHHWRDFGIFWGYIFFNVSCFISPLPQYRFIFFLADYLGLSLHIRYTSPIASGPQQFHQKERHHYL